MWRPDGDPRATSTIRLSIFRNPCYGASFDQKTPPIAAAFNEVGMVHLTAAGRRTASPSGGIGAGTKNRPWGSAQALEKARSAEGKSLDFPSRGKVISGKNTSSTALEVTHFIFRKLGTSGGCGKAGLCSEVKSAFFVIRAAVPTPYPLADAVRDYSGDAAPGFPAAWSDWRWPNPIRAGRSVIA